MELHPQVVLITYPLLNFAFPFLIRQNTDLSFAKSGRGDRTKEDHVVNPCKPNDKPHPSSVGQVGILLLETMSARLILSVKNMMVLRFTTRHNLLSPSISGSPTLAAA